MGFSFLPALIFGGASWLQILCPGGRDTCSKDLSCPIVAPSIYSSPQNPPGRQLALPLLPLPLGFAGWHEAQSWPVPLPGSPWHLRVLPPSPAPPKPGHLPWLCGGCRSSLSLESFLPQPHRRPERGRRAEPGMGAEGRGGVLSFASCVLSYLPAIINAY